MTPLDDEHSLVGGVVNSFSEARMCGLAGALQLSGGASASDLADRVGRLNRYQAHRGPDGEGLWSAADRSVVLGHRRLAIIDTGGSGRQPMWDASGRWVITFNGEIYNYRALRSELEALGTAFATQSDTEVLVNVVSRWGAAGLARLRGMFAFALWDTVERELWLARDRYGIKPLHYGEKDGVLWFASQARALAVASPLNSDRDAAALTAFYVWGHVPEPLSWWAGISLLPAGHLWRVRPGRPFGAPEPFASVADSYVAQPRTPIPLDRLKSLIGDTVAHHLVSDVEVGIFLSAGIDSNVIAATTVGLGVKPKTITLAFKEYEGTARDEASLAEATARALGTDHHTVRIGRAEFDHIFAGFIDSMDSPSIDGLNTYLVSHAAASQGLKVTLSGLGADEIFGGYPSFAQLPGLLRARRWLPFPRLIEKAAGHLLSSLIPVGVPPKVAGLFTHSSDLENTFLLRRALFLPEELEQMLDDQWIEAGLQRLGEVAPLGRIVAPLRAAGLPMRSQISALETCWYMRNQLLRDADWASMAHGLEVRVPFVDSSLLAALAPALASTRPPTKKDLAACVDTLPASVAQRAKTGFTTPVAGWIPERSTARRRGLRSWARHIHRELARAAHDPGAAMAGART